MNEHESVYYKKGYWVDRYGNRWNAEAYSFTNFLQASADLVRCENCVDCFGCIDCKRCTNCLNCVDVEDMKDLVNFRMFPVNRLDMKLKDLLYMMHISSEETEHCLQLLTKQAYLVSNNQGPSNTRFMAICNRPTDLKGEDSLIAVLSISKIK